MTETNSTNSPATNGATGWQNAAETNGATPAPPIVNGAGGPMPHTATPPEPESQPGITVVSVPKPTGGWAAGLYERIMGMPLPVGDDAESRHPKLHDDIAALDALGEPSVQQEAQRVNVLPCLMGFHHPGPWQDRVSHHRPPEWHPRVRLCRKCGRKQEAHRSIEPPFRMIQSRWRKPQRVGTSGDCTNAATGIHMPTKPYCPAPDHNPSVAQTPVWVCPRKSCLSHTDQIPDAFCGQCSDELHRRQAAGLDPYTAQPLPEPQINPR